MCAFVTVWHGPKGATDWAATCGNALPVRRGTAGRSDPIGARPRSRSGTVPARRVLPFTSPRNPVTGSAAMESTIAASTQPRVTVGDDTHKQFHVAHAVD